MKPVDNITGEHQQDLLTCLPQFHDPQKPILPSIEVPASANLSARFARWLDSIDK